MCASRLFDSSTHRDYGTDRAKWIRSLHFNNKSFSLNIEVNDRPSNWIINYIFEILLRERYGYRNINFIYAPWDSSANAIGRLNCEKSKKDCSRPPPIHVNLEVWLRTGEQVSDYAPPHRVSSNGPLGPITRWGLYANEELWNHYSPSEAWDPTDNPCKKAREWRHFQKTSESASILPSVCRDRHICVYQMVKLAK
ncbi:hypothetical protein ACTXT7_015208 [Hymenolepis weldensis]